MYSIIETQGFSTNDVFVYTVRFQWAYFINSLKGLTWQTLAMSIVGVFLVLCIFVPFDLALISIGVVIMIDLSVWGKNMGFFFRFFLNKNEQNKTKQKQAK